MSAIGANLKKSKVKLLFPNYQAAQLVSHSSLIGHGEASQSEPRRGKKVSYQEDSSVAILISTIIILSVQVRAATPSDI